MHHSSPGSKAIPLAHSIAHSLTPSPSHTQGQAYYFSPGPKPHQLHTGTRSLAHYLSISPPRTQCQISSSVELPWTPPSHTSYVTPLIAHPSLPPPSPLTHTRTRTRIQGEVHHRSPGPQPRPRSVQEMALDATVSLSDQATAQNKPLNGVLNASGVCAARHHKQPFNGPQLSASRVRGVRHTLTWGPALFVAPLPPVHAAGSHTTCTPIAFIHWACAHTVSPACRSIPNTHHTHTPSITYHSHCIDPRTQAP